MTDPHHGPWKCPECHGLAPELDDGACPWCGQEADGSYEYERPALTTKVNESSDGERSSILGLFR